MLISQMFHAFFIIFRKFHLKLDRQLFHNSFSGLWIKLFVSVDVAVGWVTATPFCRETADILVPSDWSNVLF